MKKTDDDLRREDVQIRGIQDSNSIDEQQSVDTLNLKGYTKEPSVIGAMDSYTKVINPEAGLRERQSNINDSCHKEVLNEVYKYIGRWAFRHNVPLNVIDNYDWNMMVEAIGQYGVDFEVLYIINYRIQY